MYNMRLGFRISVYERGYNTKVCLEPSRTSTMEPFCENSEF